MEPRETGAFTLGTRGCSATSSISGIWSADLWNSMYASHAYKVTAAARRPYLDSWERQSKKVTVAVDMLRWLLEK